MKRLLLSASLLLAGCGTGTLSDIWHGFPADVFDPGTGGGGGGGGPALTAQEIASIESAQEVTGDVRNIVVSDGALALAFLAAGTSGVHIVDVTDPSKLKADSYLDTLGPSILAGGRADALTIVGDYLVCVAVVGGGGTGNSVTVLRVSKIRDFLSLPEPRDFGSAVLTLVGDGIRVAGTPAGKGGSVAGQTTPDFSASVFLVATGGPALEVGVIVPLLGSWSAGTPYSSATPAVDQFLDVETGPAISSGGLTAAPTLASVKSGEKYGLVGLATVISATPPTFTPISAVQEIPGDFERFETASIAGPGNYGLEMALVGTFAYATGDGRIELYTVAPGSATEPPVFVAGTPITGSGVDSIVVEANSTTVAVASGDNLRIYQLVSGVRLGAPAVVAAPSGGRFRGLALRSSASGNFVLACAGTRGMRVIRWSLGGP